MKLELRIYKSWKQVRPVWSRLYEITPEVTPYASPEVMDITWSWFLPYYVAWKCQPEIAVVSNGEGQPVFAMALMMPLCSGTPQVYGNVNGYDACSQVCVPDADLNGCLKLLRQHYGKTVNFARFLGTNPMVACVSRIVRSEPCVAIDFSEGYDAWRQSLSKSARQNLRTSYNRLAVDGKSLNINVIAGGGKSPLKFDEIINLYCRRHQLRYGVKVNCLKRFFLKHFNFATEIYRRCGHALTFVVVIDGEMAAFMSGLVSRNGRFVVPRLSIDDRFSRYSPGVLLINETIKQLADRGVTVLDLSRGVEKYKFAMGGENYEQIGGEL